MGSKRCIQIMGYAKGSEVVSICSIVISRVLQIGGVYLAINTRGLILYDQSVIWLRRIFLSSFSFVPLHDVIFNFSTF